MRKPWAPPHSDIQDQLGHPAILIMNESYPMMSGCLDFVVQAVPPGVDRFAMNSCRQRAAVGIDADVETAEEDVPGLAAEDQLVQPIEQQRLGGIRCEMELFTLQRLDLISIGHDDVEESLGGRAKEIGKIRRVNPQAKISRVIERYRPSHEQASRSIGTTAATDPDHRSQEKGATVMLAAGKPAPDFTLLDEQGKKVTLSKLQGSPVVLYFYPKDDTSGCTKQACAFRDAFADYEQAGARVIGVSPDGVESHGKFIKKHGLPFTLLADTEKKVCEAFGVWKEKSMYGKKYMGVERTTFVIDARGVVRQIFPKVKVEGHSGAVLEALKATT